MGVDPGSRAMGYGFIRICEQKKAHYLASGIVKAVAPDLSSRLRELFVGVQSLIERYQPTELAIESVFVHANIASAIKLSHARGVAIAATFAHELAVHEYAPRQIKQAIVGYGNATKEQVAQMVAHLLGVGGGMQADAADALACALCHWHQTANPKT